jgi:serine/threonine protein kinase
MDFQKRWKKLELLGKGGQGEVYRVLDLGKFDLDAMFRTVRDAITSTQTREKQQEQFERFRNVILDFGRMEDPVSQGALKVLHLPEAARDAGRSGERISNEIRAMSENIHPSLLTLIDVDPDSKWYVSEYHPRGSLAKTSLFRGDFVGALRALRPLIEGVARLHARPWVHRDIKPHNVFVASDGRLVLGDFGLIFYADDHRTRISGTFENVGSRDWMPPWAMGMRLEDVRPSFDVFCLGKLLWGMVAPGEVLQLWYYDRAQFDLVRKYPKVPYIHLSKRIFSKSIVEDESRCLTDAGKLLAEVDELLNMVDRGGDLFEDGAQIHCRICGRGYYESFEGPKTQFFMDQRRAWNLRACTFCKNVQFFL